MRHLTAAEITKFASRKNVRAIAVENFLSSMGTNASIAYGNVELDARLYKWNAATQRAIRDGIAKGCK